MKTKEDFEQKIFKALKDGEQHDYDREDNLIPVYNYAEVKESIVFLADEYAKQQAIAFEYWAAHNRPKYESGYKWVCAGKVYEQPPTDEQLYAQFFESLNK